MLQVLHINVVCIKVKRRRHATCGHFLVFSVLCNSDRGLAVGHARRAPKCCCSSHHGRWVRRHLYQEQVVTLWTSDLHGALRLVCVLKDSGGAVQMLYCSGCCVVPSGGLKVPQQQKKAKQNTGISIAPVVMISPCCFKRGPKYTELPSKRPPVVYGASQTKINIC